MVYCWSRYVGLSLSVRFGVRADDWAVVGVRVEVITIFRARVWATILVLVGFSLGSGLVWVWDEMRFRVEVWIRSWVATRVNVEVGFGPKLGLIGVTLEFGIGFRVRFKFQLGLGLWFGLRWCLGLGLDLGWWLRLLLGLVVWVMVLLGKYIWVRVWVEVGTWV